MARVPALATVAIGTAAILLAFMVLPEFAALLIAILIFISLVLLDARKHMILLTMALRNIVRRKGTTALVIGGLMVGTAIISSSLVVGDTMNNMVVKQVTNSLGEVDFAVGSQFNGYRYFNDTYLDPLTAQFAAIPHVEASSSLVLDNVAILDNTSHLSDPSFSMLGLNDSTIRDFGHFYDLQGNVISSAPGPMQIYLNQRAAEAIDAHQGDQIVLFKGQSQVLPVTLFEVVQGRGLGAYGDTNLVVMNISMAQLFLAHPGQSNFIFISLEGAGDAGIGNAGQVRSQIDAELKPLEQTSGLKIVTDKAKLIDNAKEMADMFTSLFFVFGAFSIIAGVVLVVNIFTMLGEERKGDMGVARAIGMKRGQLRRLFTYEGTLYAGIAAAVGSALGLVLSYVIVWVMSGVFSFGNASFDLLNYFSFTPISIVLGYLAGFSLTVITVYFATRRISSLNIVRAIRNIPEPPVSRADSRTFRIGALLLVGGALLMSLGVMDEKLIFAAPGLSLITFSLGFLLRRYLSERIAWSLAGVLTLIVWLPLPFDIKIFPYQPDIQDFVVAGLFLVVSALMIVMFNSDSIIHVLTRVFRVRKEYRAVLKTAISYPLKAKFRTALSIFIFGLVIFTMTTLSVVSGLMSVNINNMVQETSGGFDVIAFTPSSPIMVDPWQYLNQSGSPLQGSNVSNLVPMPVSTAVINVSTVNPITHQTTYSDLHYSVMGFDSRFYTEGYYPLTDYNRTLYASENEAWKAVFSNGTLAIVDGSVAPQTGFGGGFGPGSGASLTLRVGDVVTLRNIHGVAYNVTVAGFMKQTSFRGFFMQKDTVMAGFGAIGTSLLLVKFQPGLEVSKQAVLLEKSFLANGLQTLDIQALAKQITSLVNSMFTLFEAFLGMGLIIGISGLGIITIRSIHERRIEIGMMRAIGYRKSMVVANFAIESAFISLLGIILGSILGIVVGYQLWQSSLQANGFAWTFDALPIIEVGLIAFVATVLSVYPAARGASKVSPADVLRFE